MTESELVTLKSNADFTELRRALSTFREDENVTCGLQSEAKIDISKKLGEQMLQGWCLLGQHCPLCHTILMSKSGKMFCFGCNLPVVHEADVPKKTALESADEESPSWEKLEAPVQEPSLDSFRLEAQADKVRNREIDRVSDALGKYMLRGWTLMDLHCEACNCPLVRSPEREMLCAACGTEYEEEGETPKNDKDQPVHIKPEHSTEGLSEPPGPPRQPFRITREVLSDSDSDCTVPAPRASRKRPLKGALMTEVDSMEAILVAKLTWCRGLLSDSSGIVECQQLAKLVRELSEAVASVNKLRPH